MILLDLKRKRVHVEPSDSPPAWRILPDAKYLSSPSGPIVFFVHGYNNDQMEAEASYDLLRANLREILQDNPQRLNHIWEVYWPGYLPKGTLLPWRKGVGNWLSVASYPYQELKTASIGESLAAYIRQIPASDPTSQTEVMFIAHSLGCRVVMEVLQHLWASSVRVLGICMMAAAVPVFKVEEGGHLHAGAKKTSNKVYILHSTKDRVLQFWFRPGQFLFHPSTFPEAVGRFGNPFLGWFEGKGLNNVKNTWLGHTEYYAGRPAKDLGPNRTRPTIARLFGRPSPNVLEDHYLVEWPELAIPEHLLENQLIENTPGDP